MIFICLTPNPPIGGEHLKIIEFRRSPLGVSGSNDFSEQTQLTKPQFYCFRFANNDKTKYGKLPHYWRFVRYWQKTG
jgi:hypothetical protein